MKEINLKKYFLFRTQASINFLWDFKTKAPHQDLLRTMLEAGIESLGIGYDSSSNAIGRAVMKNNTYNMMIKVFDAMVSMGFKKEKIRIHHFYSSPLSSFEETLEGLLLSAANVANDRGNRIARVLYTHRSEFGMLSRMNFSSKQNIFRQIPSTHYEYNFILSEASSIPMLDKKNEAFMKKMFNFNLNTQEYEETYNKNWIFAECFGQDVTKIIRRWGSDNEEDPEIRALGMLIQSILTAGYFQRNKKSLYKK